MTRLLDDPAEVSRFVEASRRAGQRELALDVEGATLHRYVDRVYLVQVSTRDATAVVDPLAPGAVDPLGALVGDPDVEVVLHDADQDLRMLARDFGWRARRLYDTRIAAQLAGLKGFGLAFLVEHYFGVKLDKQWQRADWSRRPLPPEMLDYAAQDTQHLLPLRDRLDEELRQKGRAAWAAEEFALLVAIDRATPATVEGPFERMLRKGEVRALDGRGLAVLRELAVWRDAVARAEDRPLFRVAGDEALLAIARARPDSRRVLRGLPGVGPATLRLHGDALLDAVARGMAVPEAELPSVPRLPRGPGRDPEVEKRVQKLREARDKIAIAEALEPSLIASREKLEAIARAMPRTVDELAQTPGLRRWQAELLAPLLRTSG